MTQLQQTSVHNRLLSGLAPEDFGLVQPHLESVPIDLRQWVIEAGQPIQHLYFPEHGIISILADTSEGRIEVGLIGPEGMAGLPVVLGIERSPHGYMVQAAGEAVRITAQDLRTALRHSPSLQAGFLRYAHTLMVQTAQTAYANAGFTLEARLARWILMTDDRLEREELPLTHDFLSMMLGVRRPGVTIAVQTLESDRLIRARRGRITVLDRTGLEEVADGAYGVSEAEYASVMEAAELPRSTLPVPISGAEAAQARGL
jgi:CRP-like cAMP-binding protein